MTRKQGPEAPYRPTRLYGHSKEVVTYSYEGTATITRPVPGRPWAWSETHESCGHKHPSKENADKCGTLLGERLARQANRAWTATESRRPCILATGTEERVYDSQPGYIRYCTVHDTCASRFYRTVEDAETDTWHCPWGGE